MNPIQDLRVAREPVRERDEGAERVENPITCDMVKVITVALTALTLVHVIDSLDHRESCVAWNNKMGLEEKKFSKELDKGVEIEIQRNIDADVVNEATRDEKEKRTNLDMCLIDKRMFTDIETCAKERRDDSAARKKTIKAMNIYYESNKRYQNSVRHINALQKKIEHYKEQKPIFCSRKYR